MNALKTIVLLNPPGSKLYSRDKYCSSISKADYYWVPIDLLMFSGTLKNHFNVVVIDAIIEKLNFLETSKRIADAAPSAVISLTSAASWKVDFAFLNKQKKLLNCKIILTGGFLLTLGRQVMEKHPFIDACVLDFTTDDILKYLTGEKTVRNITFRNNGEIIETERTCEKEFSIPVPLHEKFPIRKYRYPISLYQPTTCTISSFGCPFNCSFCVPGTLHFKLRNAQNVIEELKHIKSLGINEVVFQDSTFTANPEHARSICEEMINSKLRLAWICLTRVDCINQELLRLMKKAGCHTIEFGVESGDENILKKVSKNITLGKIREAFELCRKTGIKTCGFFILGLPGQDVASVEKTIDFAIRLKPDIVSFSLPMPHYGTPMGEEMLPEKNQLIQYDDLSAPKISLQSIPKDNLIKLRDKAYRKFYFRFGYIIKRIFSLRSFAQFRLELNEFFSLIRNFSKQKE